MIRTIITYQAHCEDCGHGASPACATIDAAQRFLANHRRTNYHKQNAAKKA